MATRGPQDEGRQPNPNQPANYQEMPQPTEEELKVIKSTSREATLYRGLPAGAVMAALHKGIYRKAGPLSTGLAFFFGFVMGKASYQSVLTERILQLEHSPIADRIRERQRQQQEYLGGAAAGGAGAREGGLRYEGERGGGAGAVPRTGAVLGAAPGQQARRGRGGEDDDITTGAADVDTSGRQEMRGLDDTFRPDIDSDSDKRRSSSSSSSSSIDMASTEKKFTTYEELRRKARMEDSRRASTPPSAQDAVPLASYYDDPRPAPSRSAPADDWENRPIKRREKRNKYGDIIED